MTDYSTSMLVLLISGDLSFCREFELMRDLSSFKLEMGKGLIGNETRYKEPIMDTDRSWNIFILFKVCSLRILIRFFEDSFDIGSITIVNAE